MPGRKVRDEADAKVLLDAMEASRLSVADFAARYDVDGRSLQCWKHNFARRARSEQTETVRFVELVTTKQTVAATYRMHVADVTLELSADFDDEVVLRLLDLARAC